VSAAKRQREACRRKGCEPFATLRCDDLLSAACSLISAELRLWLVLHAAWKPTQDGAKAGEAFISFSQPKAMVVTGGPQGGRERPRLAPASAPVADASP
jgi:hypothetical protein